MDNNTQPTKEYVYESLSPRAKNFYNDLIVLCHSGEIDIDVLSYVIQCQAYYPQGDK